MGCGRRCLHGLCVWLVPAAALVVALSGPSVPPLLSSLSPCPPLHPHVLSPPPLYPLPTLPTPLFHPLLPLSLPDPHLPIPLPPLYPRPLSAALAPAPPPSPHHGARSPELATSAGSPAASSAIPPLLPSWSALAAVPFADLPFTPTDCAADAFPTVPCHPAILPQPSAPAIPQPVSPLPPPAVPAVSLELPPDWADSAWGVMAAQRGPCGWASAAWGGGVRRAARWVKMLGLCGDLSALGVGEHGSARKARVLAAPRGARRNPWGWGHERAALGGEGRSDGRDGDGLEAGNRSAFGRLCPCCTRALL
ncbi:unnamed protein product [Closterium sp. Naga37s-1]|nr:unnamed protein product [Closterium sp. Naga37s-1]